MLYHGAPGRRLKMASCGECEFFKVFASGKRGKEKGSCKYSKMCKYSYDNACKKHFELKGDAIDDKYYCRICVHHISGTCSKDICELVTVQDIVVKELEKFSKRLIASAKREPEAITNNIELLLSDFKDELYKRLEKK